MSTCDADHALEALSLLDTVDLAGLNAEAELQTRVDRKYLVPLSDLAGVIDALPAGTRVLDLGGERSLRYASQYFDTPRLDSYFGAVHGRRRRFKVRARSYLDSGGAFLEVKTRGARSATVKERVPVSLDATADALDDDAVSYATELLTDAGIPGAAGLATALVPVLVTRYRRTTLLLPASDDSGPSRGTIDTELLWLTGTGEGGRMLRLPNRVIVETKSGQRAGALDRELWRRGHRPATVSKYGTGMAALHPSLPSNRWNRVLARHFARASISAVSATKPTDLDAGATAPRRREARRALASAR